MDRHYSGASDRLDNGMKAVTFDVFVLIVQFILVALVLATGVALFLGVSYATTLILCVPVIISTCLLYHLKQTTRILDGVLVLGDHSILIALYGILLCVTIKALWALVFDGGLDSAIAELIASQCLFLASFLSMRVAILKALRPGIPKEGTLLKSAGRWAIPGSVDYRLLIAGSGGHTTELISMMRNSRPRGSRMHRRWMVTEGDRRSVGVIADFEKWLVDTQEGSGTFEIKMVERARKVHQSWWTVPFSAMACGMDVFKCVVGGTPDLPSRTYPGVVVTNGPGTGFIVAMVTWIMRMMYLIPSDCCRIIYIESIARVQSLSLTGKLFYWFNIADRFIVQHEPLTKRYPGTHLEENLAARQLVRDFPT